MGESVEADFYVHLGRCLRRRRRTRGYTQGWLAAKIGVPFQQVSKYELGLNAPPVHRLLLICSIFGLTVEQLLATVPQKTDGASG